MQQIASGRYGHPGMSVTLNVTGVIKDVEESKSAMQQMEGNHAGVDHQKFEIAEQLAARHQVKTMQGFKKS